MTTKNLTGFCSRCNQNVLLKREDIDVCLAMILLIFTAGIGLIIYLAIHYNKEPNYCEYCGTKITPSQFQTYQEEIQPQLQQAPQFIPVEGDEEFIGEISNYCSYCGEKLEVRIKYCPNCGSQV